MTIPKLEWIKCELDFSAKLGWNYNYNSDNPTSCSLFINGIKTNVWYSLPAYKYYTPTDERVRKENEFFAELIRQGLVEVPTDDQLPHFDTCSSTTFVPSTIRFVTYDGTTPKGSALASIQGYSKDYTEERVRAKLDSEYWTQWCKLLINDAGNYRLATGIVVVLFDYGYSVYAE